MNTRTRLSILFLFSMLVILVVGLRLVGGRSDADGPEQGPARLGPVVGDSGQAADPPGLNPGQPGAGITGPTEGELTFPASFDGDVRNLPRIGPSEKRPMFEFELPPQSDSRGSGDVVDPVVQSRPGILAMPAPLQNFKGLDLNTWGAGWPPDTNGDVGPDHYIQTVNTSIGIYSKTGAQLPAFTFDTLFDGTGTPCDSSNQGDPIVLYDPLSGRWLISDFAWSNFVSGPYYECIAVSKTSDPVAGGWWFYGFRADDASHPWLNDYPKLGVWPDGFYMSANMFDILTVSGSATYKGVRVWALNRDDLINGAPLRSVLFDLSTTYASLLPANLRGALPPAGTPDFFGSIASPATFRLWKFHVDWVVTSNSTFTGPTNIAVASFSIPTGGVPQKGVSETLDKLGDRLMMQLQYRSLGGVESLWANHSVASGGVTGVRWYEIRNPNGAPTVQQQGSYQPDSNYRWMGSLAVDGQGNMALGYSVSSTSLFPEIRYAGRLVTDPANLLSQGETTLIAGTGSQSGGFNRWGDYSAMSVDPADDCTFWYTTEYYEVTGSNWQTRIGSFKYPGCGSAPTATPTSAPTSTSTSAPTPTNTSLPPTPTSTATAGPTSTATGAPTSTSIPSATATATPGSSDLVYVSSSTGGTAGGVSFSDEDILTYNAASATWAKYFDGSDVSMDGTDVDAFDLQTDGSILISIDSNTFSIPGLGTVEDKDVIRFIPTSTGETTAGTFEWYFDGSDVGLTTNAEDIDAIGFAPDGRLLLSTQGNVTVTGASGADEDLLAFTATQLGETTSGSWAMYFDGSDVELTDTTEDVNGVWVEAANNDIYLTTTGAFAVTGSSGDGSDIFICHPGTTGATTTCTFGPGLYWDGSASGFTGEETDGIDIVR